MLIKTSSVEMVINSHNTLTKIHSNSSAEFSNITQFYKFWGESSPTNFATPLLSRRKYECTLLWITKHYSTFSLFRIWAIPSKIRGHCWWHRRRRRLKGVGEGRHQTRGEGSTKPITTSIVGEKTACAEFCLSNCIPYFYYLL